MTFPDFPTTIARTRGPAASEAGAAAKTIATAPSTARRSAPAGIRPADLRRTVAIRATLNGAGFAERLLADTEDHPVLAAPAHAQAVAGAVDRVGVEDVAAAAEAARQQVLPIGVVADPEPEAVRRAARAGQEALLRRAPRRAP